MAAVKSNWMNGYRYLFRNVKPFWNKNGGKICTIAGTTGLFLSGVHACRTTYKYHEEFREHGRRIREAKCQYWNDTPNKRRMRIVKTVAKCSLKATKRYLPDIMAATLSSYVTSKGWGIEHNHYEQAATMVGVLAADFMNYRKNVIDEHGVDADRRYMTRRKENRKILEAEIEDGTKLISKNESDTSDCFVVRMDPSVLKIWYSKETTPMVWSESYALRIAHLEDITKRLEIDLQYGGSYSINDVRRYFYGRKGDAPCGGMFGRVWDPANPEHPERGSLVNLHYQEDEDFMEGRTDSCWIFIDIDQEPLAELLSAMNKKNLGVE